MGLTAQHFITKWKNVQGGERSQAQHFLNDLCDLIGVTRPMDGEYKYEYPLRTNTCTDRMDLYKRGYFSVEAKQTRIKASKKADANQTDLLGAPDEPEARAARKVSCVISAQPLIFSNNVACRGSSSTSRPSTFSS